jgi:hypothetical protein
MQNLKAGKKRSPKKRKTPQPVATPAITQPFFRGDDDAKVEWAPFFKK